MSDVHANPAALRAALADSRHEGCGRRLFLGDVTGYGYDAKVALELVRANFDVSLMGNHDSVLLGREPPLLVMLCSNYDIDIQQRKHLSDEETGWLRERGFVHREEGAVLVHGDLTAPREWRYILGEAEARRNFEALEKSGEQVLFCGHSHHAEVWERDPAGKVSLLKEELLTVPALEPESVVFEFKPDHRYIVNVGSVGNPRNDFCTVYGIFEPEEHRVTLRRIPFDFPDYLKELGAHGVPVPAWLQDLLRALHELDCKSSSRKP